MFADGGLAGIEMARRATPHHSGRNRAGFMMAHNVVELVDGLETEHDHQGVVQVRIFFGSFVDGGFS